MRRAINFADSADLVHIHDKDGNLIAEKLFEKELSHLRSFINFTSFLTAAASNLINFLSMYLRIALGDTSKSSCGGKQG